MSGQVQTDQISNAAGTGAVFPNQGILGVSQSSQFVTPSGVMGDTVESFIAATAFSSSATYQGLGSLTLPLGDYNIFTYFLFNQNTATITSFDNRISINPTSGTAGTAGTTENQYIFGTSGTTISSLSVGIGPIRVTYDGTTMTVYDSATPSTYLSTGGVLWVNGRYTYSAGSPQYRGVIKAERRH